MKAKLMMTSDLAKTARWALLALPGIANGESKFGLQTPQTPVAHQLYDLHAITLGVCIVVAIVVFGLMFYTILRHRRSVGHQAKQFDTNKPLQIIWTVIPCLIVVGMAFPATRTVIAMKDTSSPDLTIKVTGYQWKWRYDYIGEGVFFYSDLSTPRDQIENHSPKDENYLLEVDNPLMVPVGKKVRILLTWFKVDTPGVYRGQCTELCGKDHGFMPIVVEALPEEQYKTWLAEQQAKNKVAAAAAGAAAGKTYTLEELKTEGEKVYGRSCVACHQANGQGVPGAFPALAHGAITTGPIAGHVDIVMNGSKKNPAMAAWKGQLSDSELAAVITYERNAFGNTMSDMVQPKDIVAARK